MLFLIVLFFVFALILGPQLWVRFVLNKYHRHLDDMPGTGGELAIHLLKKYELYDVLVEKTEEGKDHYSPADNAVRLSPRVMDGKSLTAIAVATHEVGHAIQFNRKESVSYLRDNYLPKAYRFQRIGAFILMIMPVIGIATKIPHLMLINIAVGIFTMLVSVFMYAAILPEEYDASFNKALPILEQGGYVPEAYLPAIRKVLKACALTYVAAALADILRLWRWVGFLR